MKNIMHMRMQQYFDPQSFNAPRGVNLSLDAFRQPTDVIVRELTQINNLRMKASLSGQERRTLQELEQKYESNGFVMHGWIEYFKSQNAVGAGMIQNMRNDVSNHAIQTGNVTLYTQVQGLNTRQTNEMFDLQQSYDARTENIHHNATVAIGASAVPMFTSNTVSSNRNRGASTLDTQKQEAYRTLQEATNHLKNTGDSALVAELFDLSENFFKPADGGFGSIRDLSSLRSMMVAVNRTIQSGKIPTTQQEWLNIGYSPSGIFSVFQDAERDILIRFARHVHANSNHQIMVKNLVGFLEGGRKGFEQAFYDRSTLVNRSQGQIGKMTQGADGRLEKNNEDIISILTGNLEANFSNAHLRDIQYALTTALQKGETIQTIYSRVTGEQLQTTDSYALMDARTKFRDALEVHLGLIRALGGRNAGMHALFQGRGMDYLRAMQQHSTQMIQVLPKGKQFTEGQKSLLSGLLGAGVSFLTGGAVTLNVYNGRAVTVSNVLSEIERRDKGTGDWAKQIFRGLGNFVVGRNINLSIGHEEFLNAFQNRILRQAQEVVNIKFDTNPMFILNPDLRRAFEIAKANGYIQSEADMPKFHQAIIGRIIESEARGVHDYKAIWASINPIFFGVHYDRVNTEKRQNVAGMENAIEGAITAEVMKNLPQGVHVSPDFRTYTLPSKLPDLTGASSGTFDVFLTTPNGEFIPVNGPISHHSPKNLHLTLITNNGRAFYAASFQDRRAQDNQGVMSFARQVDNSPAMTARVNQIADARNALTQKHATLGGSIYVMTRDKKYSHFNQAMGLVGDQNYAGALELLRNGHTQTERRLYQVFKDNPEGLAAAMTFKYGSVNRAKTGNASASEYARAHSDGVMRAENRLTTYNKTTAEMERAFKSHRTHRPTELANIISGQNLAVSVYATPKGGTHRIDKISGSIKVSDLVLPITDANAKAEIFDRHTRDNQRVLAEMNRYLQGNLSMSDLKNWMVHGVLPAGVQPDMVTKHPQFFEARAMIQGNLCANKTEVLAYPLLRMQPRPDVPDIDNKSMATLGTSSVLANTDVSVRSSDFGITPLIWRQETPPQKTPDTPSSTPTPGRTPITSNPTSTPVPGSGSTVNTIGTSPLRADPISIAPNASTTFAGFGNTGGAIMGNVGGSVSVSTNISDDIIKGLFQ